MANEQWYKDWFDTEYYHLLYNNRNEEEAREFINKLADCLTLEEGSLVADIACGKGRHSRELALMGFQVTGYDLSENSIQFATNQNTHNARFEVHDMRKPFSHSNFAAAFNLFTSFGYFADPKEDQLCIQNVFGMLRPGGYFVQDYMNGCVYTSLMPMEGEEIRGDIRFRYKKTWDPPFIIKNIQVEDGKECPLFEERVKVYSKEKLLALHAEAGFVHSNIFGNYSLEPYVSEISNRIVIISQKP